MNHRFKSFLPNRYVYLTILAVVGSLWRSYPHLSIPGLMPSDEYPNWVFVSYLVKYHKPLSLLYVPHLQFYLMYFINLLFGISVLDLCKFINPVIGGLTVFPFYFFVSKILKQKKALLATMLFTFCEAAFYRSCYFGSTEVLSMFFMFTFFGLYVRRKYILSAILLPVMVFTHILPFIFSVGYIFVDMLTRKKSIILTLAITIGSLLFLFSPFSPHQRQAINISQGVHFSFSNISLYSLEELLLIGLPSYLGITMMMPMLFRIKKWGKSEKIFLLLSLSAVSVSWLFYDSTIACPRRFMIYVSIPLILSFAKFIKKKWIYLILVSAMIASPLTGGTNNFVWLSDSLIAEELEALQWLETEGYFKNSTEDWFSDRAVIQYMNAHSVVETQEKVKPNFSRSDITAIGSRVLTIIENRSQDQQYWRYIFLSERIQRRGFFTVTDWTEGRRSVEIRTPIADVWIDNSNWTKIYDSQGVVIYEYIG